MIMNTKSTLIAACGMNCGICYAYLREKNKCLGCRGAEGSKPESCKRCVIKNCPTLKEKGMKFCSAKCEAYPCKRLKNLDKRYKANYGMSMIANLESIAKKGIKEFVRNEKDKWTCPDCGGTICVHRKSCISCQKSFA